MAMKMKFSHFDFSICAANSDNLVRLPRKTPSKLVTGRRTTRFGAEHGDTGDRGADDEADSFASRECVARGPLACALTLG